MFGVRASRNVHIIYLINRRCRFGGPVTARARRAADEHRTGMWKMGVCECECVCGAVWQMSRGSSQGIRPPVYSVLANTHIIIYFSADWMEGKSRIFVNIMLVWNAALSVVVRQCKKSEKNTKLCVLCALCISIRFRSISFVWTSRRSIFKLGRLYVCLIIKMAEKKKKVARRAKKCIG